LIATDHKIYLRVDREANVVGQRHFELAVWALAWAVKKRVLPSKSNGFFKGVFVPHRFSRMVTESPGFRRVQPFVSTQLSWLNKASGIPCVETLLGRANCAGINCQTRLTYAYELAFQFNQAKWKKRCAIQ